MAYKAKPNGPVMIASSNGQFAATQLNTVLTVPHKALNTPLTKSTALPKMLNLTCNATTAAIIAIMTMTPVATYRAVNDAVSAVFSAMVKACTALNARIFQRQAETPCR